MRGPTPAPLHRARLERHALPPRWRVSALELVLPAVNVRDARLQVIAEGHRRADPPVPPMKRFTRESWPFSSAELAGAPAASAQAGGDRLDPLDRIVV